jgi:flagellar biosynthetic protein FlhB
MADDPDKSEKTEEPSDKKLEDAHKKGDVAKSQEVTTWFMILGSGMLFALMAPITTAGLLTDLRNLMMNVEQFDVGGPGFLPLMRGLTWTIVATAIVPMALLAVMAVVANLVQHRPVLSLDPIKPKWSKISPLAGFKRLFSTESLVNFAKGLLKLAIVGTVMFLVLWPERDRLDTMMTADPLVIMATFQQMGIKIFVATLAIITVIALADFLYQRHKWWEKQKMTIKEVRDEYKQMEGDPQVKSRIRQIRQERARKRMMSAVPDATVVITNPTHFAIALKYDETTDAPICLAKGADEIAFKIRTLAKDNDIPIVENPPLARALYTSVELDETIPNEHFKAVAQVIGYVMRLKKSKAWRA